MKLVKFILRYIIHKCLSYRYLLEKYNAKNLQDFAQTAFDFQFLLDDCNKDINTYGYPDLSLYGIDTGAEECLDAQVLLDPFEKYFYSPTAFVKLCNCQCRQSKIVC